MRSKRVWLGGLFLLPAGLAAASAAAAPAPAVMTEQGRLFDGAGAPLQGSVAITFSLYAAANGGAPLWSEALTLPLDDGYFSTELGTVTPFSAGVWDGSQRWLGIQVGADPEMAPRQATASV